MSATVAVVIPCFRVRARILDVLGRIGPECQAIYVVDDACPEQTGHWVREQCRDPRVRVIFHEANQGVGGAVITGYRQAMAAGATVIVKVDGDGQMDPRLVPAFVTPILRGDADYTKGNRFFRIQDVKAMPLVRLIGNAGLSFMTKLSSGYWNLFDPTNGYTAIHAAVARLIPLEQVSRGYFFESDMLFNLNILRAKVDDVPMAAVYGDHGSSLRPHRVAFQFLLKNLGNAGRRIFYNYFLRDFSLASVQLLTGLPLLVFGIAFGVHAWVDSAARHTDATTGTVMLAALPIILGLQLLLSFVAFDFGTVPRQALHPGLGPRTPEDLPAP